MQDADPRSVEYADPVVRCFPAPADTANDKFVNSNGRRRERLCPVFIMSGCSCLERWGNSQVAVRALESFQRMPVRPCRRLRNAADREQTPPSVLVA
jgi:hypothetical protein